MFLVGLISWWYGRGWSQQMGRILARLKATLDFFSVGQLLSTLFAPFRQISAASGSDGTFGTAIRGMFDKLISRCVGAFVRSITIFVGLLVILVQGIFAVISIIGWWIIPLLPVVGLILLAIGWVPTWM